MRTLTDDQCREIVCECFAQVYDVDDLGWVLPEHYHVMPDSEDGEIIAEKLAELWSVVLGEFVKDEDEEEEE